MPVKPPDAPPVEDLDDGFEVRTLTLRGTKYVMRELSAADYQKCIDMATTDEDVEGVTLKRTDQNQVTRLMMGKALIEPKLTVAQIWERPTSVVRRLSDELNALHFTSLESDEEKAEREAKEKDDDEGEAKEG